MTYNPQKTWNQLSIDAGNYARSLIQILINGNNAYNEWQSVRNGRDNIQIANDLSTLSGETITEAMVIELDSCYAAMKMLYDYSNNQTPFQSDYLYSLRKFS